MAILDKIEELPAKQRVLIVAVLLLAMVGGFYYFSYKKKTAQITNLEAQLSKVNSELQDLRAIQKKLEEFKGMIVELEAQLTEAQRQLPRQREIPKLLKDISKFGKESGMEFISFRPTPEQSQGFYAEVPINLAVNGPFHNMASYVDKITHYPRIIVVKSLTLGNPVEKEGHVMLRATCQAVTYRYIEESEQGQ